MKQFIKSWSKYILVEYHLDGFLFLCTSLLLCELLLGILIIHNVSCRRSSHELNVVESFEEH